VLVILARTLIIFFFLLIVMRLMGKRQIGELQPFELVITLAVAELACTPMQDISVPIVYGLGPIFLIFVVHYFITLLSTKSIRFRKFLNGKPIIVINQDGIDYASLKKLNMNVNDLLESIRGMEYFSIEQVSFAIVETNGNISVLPNEAAEAPKSVPLSLIVEGKYIDANLAISNTHRDQINDYLKNKKLKVKDVILLTSDSNKLFVQPYHGKYFTEQLPQ
jgi:Predicted membrane protein